MFKIDLKNVNFGDNRGGSIGDNFTVYNGRSELSELSQLLSQIQSVIAQANITAKQREDADRYITIIKEEAQQGNPRKKFIENACNGLKKIVSSQGFWNLVDRISSHFV